MKFTKRWAVTLLSLCTITLSAYASSDGAYKVKSLQITTLSTMVANRGIGEWGYSALVEVDGRKILFDTGRIDDTVLKNAETLGIDLSQVDDVILSHNHGDHTGGLITLRAAVKDKRQQALSNVHVGEGIFLPRVGRDNRMLAMKNQLSKDGVTFKSYQEMTEIYPGVWLTGNVPRVHPEKNWSGNGKIAAESGHLEDNIPEDMSLVINTEQGLVLISGCGHAGIINTIEHITNHFESSQVTTAIGGFHLMFADDKHLQWTANKLKLFGLNQMMGAHCTGIDALYTLRSLLNSDRKHMVVGTVGDSFSLSEGVKPGAIAR